MASDRSNMGIVGEFFLTDDFKKLEKIHRCGGLGIAETRILSLTPTKLFTDKGFRGFPQGAIDNWPQ